MILTAFLAVGYGCLVLCMAELVSVIAFPGERERTPYMIVLHLYLDTHVHMYLEVESRREQ